MDKENVIHIYTETDSRIYKTNLWIPMGEGKDTPMKLRDTNYYV